MLGRQTHTKVWRLPYKVHQCSAVYYPDQSNGLLNIKINKFLGELGVSKEDDSRKRVEICKYSITGDPKSLYSTTSFTATIKNDHYTFTPDKIPKEHTHVTVFLQANRLQFETYLFSDLSRTRTTQTVTLPVIPIPQQFFITENEKFKIITLYPYKYDSDNTIPDQTIVINPKKTQN